LQIFKTSTTSLPPRLTPGKSIAG